MLIDLLESFIYMSYIMLSMLKVFPNQSLQDYLRIQRHHLSLVVVALIILCFFCGCRLLEQDLAYISSPVDLSND